MRLPINTATPPIRLVTNFGGEVCQLDSQIDDVHLRAILRGRSSIDPLHTNAAQPALTLQRSVRLQYRFQLRLCGRTAAIAMPPQLPV